MAVVLCGHVHQHQVLRRDLRARSVERDETKGFVLATIGAGELPGRLVACEFRPLPARPMRVYDLADRPGLNLRHEIRAAIDGLPPDVVVQLRAPESLAGAVMLSAPYLRALCPATANVTVAVRR